jgi:hypothetical protein
MQALFEFLSIVIAVGGMAYIFITTPKKIGQILNPPPHQGQHHDAKP